MGNNIFNRMKAICSVLCFLVVVLVTPHTSEAQLLWTVGANDNGWPFTAQNPGDGGGPNTTFVQEAGVNPLPGNPNSPETDQAADDDYYFVGDYSILIDSVINFYGAYSPLADPVVTANEEAAERAFAGND